ncbi:MAG: hypothetical protein KDM91_00210 [Verrucomicrobiae bacterium]|nr:hypothetical protein [Verrucomicrobiae bacterium]
MPHSLPLLALIAVVLAIGIGFFLLRKKRRRAPMATRSARWPAESSAASDEILKEDLPGADIDFPELKFEADAEAEPDAPAPSTEAVAVAEAGEIEIEAGEDEGVSGEEVAVSEVADTAPEETAGPSDAENKPQTAGAPKSASEPGRHAFPVRGGGAKPLAAADAELGAELDGQITQLNGRLDSIEEIVANLEQSLAAFDVLMDDSDGSFTVEESRHEEDDHARAA